MKVQVKRAFKSNFLVTKKVIKMETGSAWNFLQRPIPVCRGAFIPYFKISGSIFCWPLFSENYLNPQVKINRMLNKHTVDYHPNPSQLTPRIHPLIFLWTFKGFISPKYLFNFFSNLYISQWLRKSFKFMMLRLLANKYICESQNWICSFFLMPTSKTLPMVFIITPQAEGNYPFLPNSVFWRSIFPEQKRGGLWSWKNYQN